MEVDALVCFGHEPDHVTLGHDEEHVGALYAGGRGAASLVQGYLRLCHQEDVGCPLHRRRVDSDLSAGVNEEWPVEYRVSPDLESHYGVH